MIVELKHPARRAVATQRFTDQDLLQALQQVAKLSHAPLSVAKYEQLRTDDHPSSALIIQRFGSWGDAVRRAYLPTAVVSRSYQKKFSLADAIAITKKYLNSTTNPSYQDFAQWLKTQPKAPSAQTCRNLAGSWQQLITAAKN